MKYNSNSSNSNYQVDPENTMRSSQRKLFYTCLVFSVVVIIAATVFYQESSSFAYSIKQSFTQATNRYFDNNVNHKPTPQMDPATEIEQMKVSDVITAKPFSLPSLSYSVSAMEPVISAKTMTTHYSKHHAGYVKKLNDLTKNTPFETMSLEDVVKNSEGPIFNNAAQHWNHMFFWKILSPVPTSGPQGALKQAIEKSFGDYETFKKKFTETATGVFGSGWAWVVKDSDGNLFCEGTPNGVNPIKTGSGKPIIGLDVWEHSYYLDYQQDRPAFIRGFFSIINWDAANSNYASS